MSAPPPNPGQPGQPADGQQMMTPEQQMMMFQMMMQQQMMMQGGGVQPGGEAVAVPGAVAPAAAGTPQPEVAVSSADEITDDTSIGVMLATLNQKLKKSQKMMTKWQEYIEDDQCLETVGELVTVIKHPEAWKDFGLPAIAKIAIEELLHGLVAPASDAKPKPATGSTPAPAPEATPAPQEKEVTEEEVISQPPPVPPASESEDAKDEPPAPPIPEAKADETEELPPPPIPEAEDDDEPPPPPIPEEGFGEAEKLPAPPAPPVAEEGEEGWFPPTPPPQPPGPAEEAAAASEEKKETPEEEQQGQQGPTVDLKPGEVLGMEMGTVLPTEEGAREAFSGDEEIQYWIEDMGAVTAENQTGFHVVVTNTGGKQAYENQNLYLQNIVVEVHGPRGPIDVIAKLLPIQGPGVPDNVVTDFSTEAAFLFLSSSIQEECPFSVGDSLAFTEKMTSIWFAFTPPEEGVYSLYIFHNEQEVGAAEFDVFGKGMVGDDGMLPDTVAPPPETPFQTSTLRGLICEIDGLEEFVKAGVEAKFTVRPVNEKREPQRVFVQLQTMIKGPDGRIIKATVVPREDGTYDIFCNPPKKGQYQVQLLENAELVATQPNEIFMQAYGDEAEDANVQKGIMRVLVADDAVLKQLGLNSTVKTVKVSQNTTNTELKELVLKHMSRGMNLKQLKAIEARCKTFSIKEVGEGDEEIRALGIHERVWPWERDHGTKTTRLVFSHAKGHVQVYLQEDALLEQLGLQNTSKNVEVRPDTDSRELRSKMLQVMTKGLNTQQQKAVRQQCKYYRIYEVVTSTGTVRRLEENEFVWAWERNNPGETQLVFKQLIGLLNFAIGYPETSVQVGQPVEVRVKVRDPDRGNQLVNNHRGELALFVCPAGEGADEEDLDEGMDDLLTKVIAEKVEQDGVFAMNFTPPEAGYFHMMMKFNGFPLQDRVYKLHVVTKNAKKKGLFGKPSLKRHDSAAGDSKGKKEGGSKFSKPKMKMKR